jgi:flagellin-like protein
MKRLFRNNKGVSTIVATSLLVALVVILGVALASTVQPSQIDNQPMLQIQCTASISANEIRLTHVGGDTINTGSVVLYTYIPEGSGDSNAGARCEVVLVDNPITAENEAYAIKSHPNPSTGEFSVGDTLVLNFDDCLARNVWGGLQWPVVGGNFVVELYFNGQPLTVTTMTVQG